MHPDGSTSPAAPADAHLVIIYHQNRELRWDRIVIGNDMLSEPMRREAVMRSLETGRAMLTGPIVLAGQETATPSLIAFMAIPSPQASSSGPAMSGAVSAGIDVSLLVKSIAYPNLAVTLIDRSADMPHGLLYADVPSDTQAGLPAVVSREFEIGGRRWEAQYAPRQPHPAWWADPWTWAVAALGLLVTVLIAGTMRLQSLLNARMQAFAQRQARDAKHMAEQLATIGTQREQLELSHMRLERQNRDMERFVSAVSHDLKSPLASLSMLCQLLISELKDRSTPQINELITDIKGSLSRTFRLMDDLVAHTRMGVGRLTVEPVHQGELAAEIIEQNGAAIREAGTQIHIGMEMPVVQGDRARLAAAMDNLAVTR